MRNIFSVKGQALKNIFLAAPYLLCVLGIAVAGHAQDAKTIAAAESEGKVIVYGPPGPNYRPALIDAFQKDYPKIKVEFFGSSGQVAATKLIQERKAGLYNADLYISGSTNGVVTLKRAGAVENLPDFLAAPDVVNPKVWLDDELQWADAKPPLTTLMFECGISQIVHVNPKVVDPKQFTSYKDLLDPKWKGKITGTDIRRPGPGGVPSRFIYKNPQLGPEYLTRLFKDTGITLSSDQRQLTDWIAQGQYPVGIFVGDSTVKVAQEAGLPIVAIPVEQFKEGGPIGPGYGSLSFMKNAPNPNAAKVYVNWLLSPSGQVAWQDHAGKPSCRIDIPRKGINETDIPKGGFKYVKAGTEEFSSLTGSTIRNLVTKALKARK